MPANGNIESVFPTVNRTHAWKGMIIVTGRLWIMRFHHEMLAYYESIDIFECLRCIFSLFIWV